VIPDAIFIHSTQDMIKLMNPKEKKFEQEEVKIDLDLKRR
jgi:hypothetical protein